MEKQKNITSNNEQSTEKKTSEAILNDGVSLFDPSHIRKIIVDIIAEIAPDEDVSSLKDEIRLREQLELDSMDFLDIVMELRKKYNIEIPEADYSHLETLKSCVEYLMPKFNKV